VNTCLLHTHNSSPSPDDARWFKAKLLLAIFFHVACTKYFNNNIIVIFI